MRADETLGLRVRISTAENTRKATSILIQVTTDGIQVSDFPDTGRGCQATRDLSQGQVILNVKDVVTVEKVIEAEFGEHPCPVSKSGIVKWGASFRCSSSLHLPMRNSDQMITRKTHPTLR